MGKSIHLNNEMVKKNRTQVKIKKKLIDVTTNSFNEEVKENNQNKQKYLVL